MCIRDRQYSAQQLEEITYLLLQKNKLSNAYIRPLISLGPNMSLQPVKQVNIFILTSNELTDTYDKYPLLFTYDPSKNTKIVVHENECHFKLLGHNQGIMRTYYTHENLPIEIKTLFNV